MRNLFICLLFFAIMSYSSFAQKATIHEEMMEMNTYMFSDPDPVANIGRIYPYFYFHGYTNHPTQQKRYPDLLDTVFKEMENGGS